MNAAEYSKFDENGIPTHNNKDKELSEAIRNKLKKEQEKQKGVYEKWLTNVKSWHTNRMTPISTMESAVSFRSCILSSFNWCGTPEGYAYWDSLSSK